MTTEISLNMNTLFALLQNTEILTNCDISFNRVGNVTVQAPNSETRYTIGSLNGEGKKFWIRGARYARWGREIPYRLHIKRVKSTNWPYYDIEYTFDSVQEVYNYFCNFWRKYKLNK